jgi:hypothetical protein
MAVFKIKDQDEIIKKYIHAVTANWPNDFMKLSERELYDAAKTINIFIKTSPFDKTIKEQSLPWGQIVMKRYGVDFEKLYNLSDRLDRKKMDHYKMLDTIKESA